VKNDGGVQWYDIKAEVPESGGIESSPTNPNAEPQEIPEGLIISRSIKVNGSVVVSGDGQAILSSDKKTVSFPGIGWSTSSVEDEEIATLESSVILGLSRWVGEIKIRTQNMASV